MTERAAPKPGLDWLPPGKRAAICFTVDDVHPSRSTDAYEAGGDLGRGALGHVEWLLERHARLMTTLFVTADWREISPVPTRRLLASIPYLRDLFYLAEPLPPGTMRLGRHPEFVRYLKQLPRTDVGLHGLHHLHKGPRIPVEFQEQDVNECRDMLRRALSIFDEAGLAHAPGMTPPGWNLPPALARAMAELGFTFVASARDIRTPVSPSATAQMSGVRGVSLIYPELIENGRLVHMTSNFQATSPLKRAFEIVEAGGLLAIKAHITKNALGVVALDGMDETYRDHLDRLFRELDQRYGESLWWTSMSQVVARTFSKSLQYPQTEKNNG